MLGLPLLLGLAIHRALGLSWRSEPLAHLGTSWIAGALGLGALLFVWCCLRLPLTLPPLASTSVFIAVTLGVIGKRSNSRSDSPTTPARSRTLLDLVWLATIIALGGVILDMIVTVNQVSMIRRADEAEIWASKAKVIFSHGGFGPGFGEACRTNRLLHHADYPLLNPLLQVWAFVCNGEIVHAENRLPIQAFFMAMLFYAAAAFRREAGPLLASAGLIALVAALGSTVLAAYSDVMIAAGTLLALDGWIRQHRAPSARARLTVILGLTTIAWSKHEGAMLLLVFLLAWSADRVSRRGFERSTIAAAARMAALPLLAIGVTWWLNHRHELRNDLVQGTAESPAFWVGLLEEGAERSSQVTRFFCVEILGRHWILLGPLVAILAAPRVLSRAGLVAPAAVIAVSFLGYAIVFLGTPHDLEWHLTTAAPRVAGQLIPAALMWSVAALPVLWSKPPPDAVATAAA